MGWLFASGHAADLILAVLAIEAVWLIARGRQALGVALMLLPAALAKEQAKGEGAKEAWFVDEAGYVTEGASSNAWIVDRQGRLVTRQVDNAILRGVTRTTLIDLLRREAIELVERPLALDVEHAEPPRRPT